MGVAINFVIFPQSSISEVGIRSCTFHAAGPGTRVSHISVAQYSPVDAGWKVSKHKGDAGWKFGGCWVETVWGSKKTAKIYKFGVCKQYILQQREQKLGCAVCPLGYISTRKVLV